MASADYVFIRRRHPIKGAGLPHSDTPGSRPVDGSPRIVAVFRVLLRLLMPRHPSCARIRLAEPAARKAAGPCPEKSFSPGGDAPKRERPRRTSYMSCNSLYFPSPSFQRTSVALLGGERMCSISFLPLACLGGIFKNLLPRRSVAVHRLGRDEQRRRGKTRCQRNEFLWDAPFTILS